MYTTLPKMANKASLTVQNKHPNHTSWTLTEYMQRKFPCLRRSIYRERIRIDRGRIDSGLRVWLAEIFELDPYPTRLNWTGSHHLGYRNRLDVLLSQGLWIALQHFCHVLHIWRL